MPDTMVDEIWSDDLLERRADADFLFKFLLARIDERGERGASRSYVLNLDAGWGDGKSFFLNRLGRQLTTEGYLVANVNSWRDDHADDPLIAVMAAINEVLLPLIQKDETSKKLWKSVKSSFATVTAAAVKGTTKHYLKKMLGGETIDDIANALDLSDDEKDAAVESTAESVESFVDKKADDLLKKFKDAQNSISGFRQNLSRFLAHAENGDIKTPLFVLVDELDRCRPTYAVTLLERVKHLFDTDGVVFIIATNTRQLRHSIAAVYGTAFDSERYLNRFFDRRYIFEESSISSYVEAAFAEHDINTGILHLPLEYNVQQYMADGFKYFGLSLRDVNQCMDIFRSCLTVWDKNINIELAALFPFIIAAHQNIKPEWSHQFIDLLERIRKANNIAFQEWHVTFMDRDSFDRPSQNRTKWMDVFSFYLNIQSLSLDKVLENYPSRGIEQSVRNSLSNEFNRLHGNRFDPRNPPFSILQRYPQLVRSAGRLRP